MAKKKQTKTFIVKINECQNSTWQGSVLWAETKQEQYFRSALELLKLIDGAGTEDEREIGEGGSQEKGEKQENSGVCALHGSDADNQHVYYGRRWSDR